MRRSFGGPAGRLRFRDPSRKQSSVIPHVGAISRREVRRIDHAYDDDRRTSSLPIASWSVRAFAKSLESFPAVPVPSLQLLNIF